jgi:hypothetical protein
MQRSEKASNFEEFLSEAHSSVPKPGWWKKVFWIPVNDTLGDRILTFVKNNPDVDESAIKEEMKKLFHHDPKPVGDMIRNLLNVLLLMRKKQRIPGHSREVWTYTVTPYFRHKSEVKKYIPWELVELYNIASKKDVSVQTFLEEYRGAVVSNDIGIT